MEFVVGAIGLLAVILLFYYIAILLRGDRA